MDALGTDLPAVARSWGLRAKQLYGLLLQDWELTVDQGGRLHYADPAPDDAARPTTVTPDPVVVFAESFSLLSLLSASRTIDLDFNSHLLSGTAWNTSYNAGADIAAPAFDTDGDPLTFSDAERAVIQQVWLRVAEEFAPLPRRCDDRMDERRPVVPFQCGGRHLWRAGASQPDQPILRELRRFRPVRFVRRCGNTYKLALVFPEMLSNNAKYIAEACAHESGHTLGLNHDGLAGSAYYSGQGSGETCWAPITVASY